MSNGDLLTENDIHTAALWTSSKPASFNAGRDYMKHLTESSMIDQAVSRLKTSTANDYDKLL